PFLGGGIRQNGEDMHRLKTVTVTLLQSTTHGLRNELAGSERPSQNGLFEGKELLFFQQGDQYDKYRRFFRSNPHIVRVGSLPASLVWGSRAGRHASQEARSAHQAL
ncbi:MAG TPA: hypothetical protein VF844_03515, partial [Ktedonobacteraceae bacterium]